MTGKANRLVGTMVKATSRRGFLGSAVKLAAGAAAMLAGALVGRPAQAAKPGKTALCCWYVTPKGGEFAKCFRGRKRCPDEYQGAWLWGVYEVSDCSECWVPYPP